MPSTAIRDWAYDADEQWLLVEFTTGRRYLYADVPPQVADALARAASKGRAFNALIRDRYDFVELEAAG